MAAGLKNTNAGPARQEAEERQLLQKERHLKLLKSKEKPPSNYFYQVGNPMELAKIGQAFQEEFKLGVKSFAVTSTDYKSSQQRTVLALACYFDHLFDMKILIISDSLDMGMLAEVKGGSEQNHIEVPGTTSKLPVHRFLHHFDLIDLNQLQQLNTQGRPNYEYEQALQHILGQYDIIFWDAPTLSAFKSKTNSYAQTLGFIESLTIIVSQAVSNSKDVNEMKEYFSAFGVNIKGVVFDRLQIEDMNKKKKKWGFF